MSFHVLLSFPRSPEPLLFPDSRFAAESNRWPSSDHLMAQIFLVRGELHYKSAMITSHRIIIFAVDLAENAYLRRRF